MFTIKGEVANYAEFFPPQLRSESWHLNRQQFIGVSILIVIGIFLVFFLYELYSRKLIIKIADHLKNRALEKFRNLPLEEKLKRKGETNHLATDESE